MLLLGLLLNLSSESRHGLHWVLLTSLTPKAVQLLTKVPMLCFLLTL